MITHRLSIAPFVLSVVVACFGWTNSAPAQCAGWNQIQAVGPSIRSSHSMVFDSLRGRAVLFGGYGPKPDGSEYLGDLWEFDGNTWSLRTTSGPPARQSAGLAFDSARGRVVLFGGLSYTTGPTTFGQTWEWNGSTWANLSSTGPSPRYLHAMAYDAARQKTVLFGGLADGSFRDTYTWTWNGSTWTQVTSVGPPPRFGHAMAYDAARQRVVLFGGFGGAGDQKTLLHDTWEWNGSAWSLVASNGPEPRQFHAMAYDPIRQRVVLAGGRADDGTAIDDLWEWNGASWVQASGIGPGARESSAMCFDTLRQKLIVAGGFSERGRLGDAWERSLGTGTLPSITVSPSPRRALPGSTFTLQVQASGSGPLTYQWLRNGSALVESPRVTGVATPSLTIHQADWMDTGSYAVRVSNSCGSVISSSASVNTNCPADVDNGTFSGTLDGAVEISDLIAFLYFFERGDVHVDIDNGSAQGTTDGAVDISDLLYFLARFEVGC